MNVSFNMLITNIDKIHDMAFNNKIRIQLLWEDSHPAPDIFFYCVGYLQFRTSMVGVSESLRRVGSNEMLEGLL